MEENIITTFKLMKRRVAPLQRKEAGYYFAGSNPASKRGSISRQLDGNHLPILKEGLGWRSVHLGVWEGV